MLRLRHEKKSQKIFAQETKGNYQETSELVREAQRNVIYPTLQDVLDVADEVAREANQKIFPLAGYKEKIEAAIARAQGVYFGHELYPTLFGKAAALLSSLIMSHPFSNGNKRIAIITAVQFLAENGIPITISSEIENECIDLLIGVAQGNVTAEDVERWFEEHF